MTITTEAPAKGPTKQLEEALHAHFIRPEDRTSQAGTGAIYLTEVTAPGSSRRADAVHIGLWQNRGAGRIDVCELKTSRADFLRELDQPAKAEAWWPYCTAFWLVVPHVAIAGPNDIPPGWGLMTPGGRGRRFKVLVKPEEREPELTVGLLLTLLKNTETSRTNDLRFQQEKLWQQYQEKERKLRSELGSRSDPEVQKRLQLLDELEAAMGKPLTDFVWHGNNGITPTVAAAALKDYVAGRAALATLQDDLRYRADEITRTAAELTKGAATIRNAIANKPTREQP